MSLLRYNWLRKRGYGIVSGVDWLDPIFGDKWVELVMSNGKELKKVKINGGMKVAEFITIEKLMDTHTDKWTCE